MGGSTLHTWSHVRSVRHFGNTCRGKHSRQADSTLRVGPTAAAISGSLGATALDADGTDGDLNDLWEFNPSTNEWTWMGGSSTPCCNAPGVYGTLGVPAPANIPGGRFAPSIWTDLNGNLWLFGGWEPIARRESGISTTFGSILHHTVFPPAPTPTFSVPREPPPTTQTVTISDDLRGNHLLHNRRDQAHDEFSDVYRSRYRFSRRKRWRQLQRPAATPRAPWQRPLTPSTSPRQPLQPSVWRPGHTPLRRQ